MKKETIIWFSIDDQLPKPECDVLARFDDGTVMYLWQNWENGVKNDPENTALTFTYYNTDGDPIKPIEWAYV